MAHTRGQVEFRHLAWKEDKGEKISVDTNDPDSEKCFNFNKILNKNSQKYFIVYCLLMFQNENRKIQQQQIFAQRHCYRCTTYL